MLRYSTFKTRSFAPVRPSETLTLALLLFTPHGQIIKISILDFHPLPRPPPHCRAAVRSDRTAYRYHLTQQHKNAIHAKQSNDTQQLQSVADVYPRGRRTMAFPSVVCLQLNDARSSFLQSGFSSSLPAKRREVRVIGIENRSSGFPPLHLLLLLGFLLCLFTGS